jgi:hypothetical protein
MPTGGGGGDAAPADSGADASVRLAGRTSSTQLTGKILSSPTIKSLPIRLIDFFEVLALIFFNGGSGIFFPHPG